MADEFDTESLNMIADLKAAFATTITYTRPKTGQTASIAAGLGEKTTEQLDASGVFEKIESRDWIVAAADLSFTDGTGFVPTRKDTIATSTATYEVIGLGPDGPAWEYSDRHERIVRIHSQRVQ